MGANIEENTENRGTFSRPETVAKLSIFTISLLIVMKVAASIVTGSIGIRADAIHSTIDLSGAVIGFIAIRVAGRPADDRHPFGHGKAEDIAGTVVAGLIFFAAGTIFYEAIRRLLIGGTVELVALGIYVTAAAIVVNIAVSWWVLRIAKSADSVALEATGRDLLADVLSSCAVLVGLVLVRLTGNSTVDPIVSLLVAFLIARTAYYTMRKSVGGLMDASLPDDEQETIKSIITQHSEQLLGFHELRTRKVGNRRHIYLHLVMPNSASVNEAHAVCDHLEQEIDARLQRTDVAIHVEPCAVECEQCSASCSHRKDDHLERSL